MNDDPKTWGLPAPRLQWEVFAVDKKGKACSRAVYVAAPTQERAIAAGKYWRKVVGMKAAKVVVARRYYPQHDPSMAAWIKKH